MREGYQYRDHGPKYHFLFASAMFGGNTSLFESLRDILSRREDFDSEWLLMDEDPPELITRIPPISRNWTMKGGLSMRSRVLSLEKQGRRFDAAYFNHLIPAIFLGGFRRRVPILLGMDVTPLLLDMYGRWYGVPVTSKINPLEKLKYRLALSAYSDARYLVPWNHWIAKSLQTDYHMPPEKIRVIPAGVDISRWVPHRKETPSIHPLRILFVGSDFVRKGGDLVLSLARREEFSSCEFHLLSHTEVHPLSRNVVVHSRLRPNSDGLLRLYRESDIFILPTRGDLSPIAILEAMAMELPVITTAIGGIPELVSDGVTGFLVPPDDVDMLASRLRILVENVSLRLRFGKHARKIVEQRFNLCTCAESIVGYLKAAANKSLPAVFKSFQSSPSR